MHKINIDQIRLHVDLARREARGSTHAVSAGEEGYSLKFPPNATGLTLNRNALNRLNRLKLLFKG